MILYYLSRITSDIYILSYINILPQAPCSGGSIEETRECCSVQNPCIEGAGDCDEDDECEGDLVCGKNNCGHSFTWASADCCEKKDENDDVPEEQKIEAGAFNCCIFVIII